ncbi:MAG TPA: hypothetical protein VGL86_18095 [Polyangia bacterium]|jgi:hypothetical protein
MKKLILMAFTTAAMAACNGAGSAPTTTATAAAGPTATVTATTTDASRADAKAAEVASTIGSVLHGGDPDGHYVLGEALPLYYVHQSALASAGRVPAESLLGEALDRIYPVSLDGKIVGSITLHKVDGQWQPSAIGQGAASGKLADARAELRRAVQADDDAFAVVHVIGPNARFLAHRQSAALQLTALADGEALAPRAAADVFADLAARVQ